MISIAIPVYNEEKNLESLEIELDKVMKSTGEDYEIIYIDDGSCDKSLAELIKISQRDEKVKIIHLMRHYGQTEAMQAGIDYSKGRILVFMDADGQNDPRDIPRLLAKIEEGYDVVSGWRKDRKDPLLTRRLPSFLANKLISVVTGLKLNDYGCTLKAYKKEAIKGVKLYGEMHRFIPVYAAMKGYSVAEVEVSHNKRTYGKSKYGLLRIFKVILDLFTVRFIGSYLTKPIYLFGGIGLCLFLCGILVGVFVVIRKVVFGGIWISPLLFITITLLIMGVQFILMGLLAEIIIRIYYRSQTEAPYLIKRIIKSKRPVPNLTRREKV